MFFDVLNSRTSLPIGQFAQIVRAAVLNYRLKEKQIFMRKNSFWKYSLWLHRLCRGACGRSHTGIAVSKPGGGVDVCLLWVLVVVRLRSLPQADPSSGGDLPSVCVYVMWVWSGALSSLSMWVWSGALTNLSMWVWSGALTSLSTYNESVDETRLRKEKKKERKKETIISIFQTIV
jgi:hypothetical protein